MVLSPAMENQTKRLHAYMKKNKKSKVIFDGLVKNRQHADFLINHESTKYTKLKLLHILTYLRALRVLRGKKMTFYRTVIFNGHQFSLMPKLKRTPRQASGNAIAISVQRVKPENSREETRNRDSRISMNGA
jgi:hypothetical protein